MTTHRPIGIEPPDDSGIRRALILSGGGIRLSYQAGVLRALREAGLTFSHLDATSGGAINMAMVLTGQSPEEMCHRWRTLDLKDFIGFLPLDQYLKASDLTAMGSAEGIRERVFPHLGIDLERVREAQGCQATFNVFNYTDKVNEAIPHTELDEDLLVASMSLPGVLPPVPRSGRLYLDSAFVRDANLLEMVRRGANELWLVWCLGNSNTYRGGPLNLYVQMLEMSANGALNDELQQIAGINERIANGERVYGHDRPIRLHLIRPDHPLPLDPELYTGRIDHATLINMGYGDARSYLARQSAEGVPLVPESLKMQDDDRPGIAFRETMKGGFTLGVTDPEQGADGETLSMHASILIRDIDAFVADPDHTGTLTGDIDFPPFGKAIPASHGVFNLFSPENDPRAKRMVYELGFRHQGQDYYLAGHKEVKDDPGFDLWKDTTTLFTRLHQGIDASGPVVGAGVLSLGIADLMKLVSTLRATNCDSVTSAARTLGTFGRFFLGELWDSYARLAGRD